MTGVFLEYLLYTVNAPPATVGAGRMTRRPPGLPERKPRGRARLRRMASGHRPARGARLGPPVVRAAPDPERGSAPTHRKPDA
jgi:hypothetical protein